MKPPDFRLLHTGLGAAQRTLFPRDPPLAASGGRRRRHGVQRGSALRGPPAGHGRFTYPRHGGIPPARGPRVPRRGIPGAQREFWVENPDSDAVAAPPAPRPPPAAACRLQGRSRLAGSRRGEGLRPGHVGAAGPACGTETQGRIGSGGPSRCAEILDMGHTFNRGCQKMPRTPTGSNEDLRTADESIGAWFRQLAATAVAVAPTTTIARLFTRRGRYAWQC